MSDILSPAHAADDRAPALPGPARQQPFARVAPLLRAALILGAGGGFALAAALTLTRALGAPLGLWWVALAQAHGHLQLFGWAGLFVLGVAFHFLPRLRGAGLAVPWLIPWILAALVTGLLLRVLCQPLLSVAPDAGILRVGIVVSGMLELAALAGAATVAVRTAVGKPPLVDRVALWSVLPFAAGAFTSLVLAALANLANMFQVTNGIVPAAGDTLNITLGLFGFLVPMALAMSARSLPMYAGLDAFPQRTLWPLAGAYLAGLLLVAIEIVSGAFGVVDGGMAGVLSAIGGIGLVVMGAVLLVFIFIFLRMMRSRGKIPKRVAELAPDPQPLERAYAQKVVRERNSYGPFVGLIASAYMWAILAGVLLVVDGVSQLFTGDLPIAMDAIRHALAIGFIALLLSGVAPRMLPGFSGGHIVSGRLVAATLWLGNAAAVLRVGSILFGPMLVSTPLDWLDALLFGLSGPLGLTLAVVLAINLWPALQPSHKPAA